MGIIIMILICISTLGDAKYTLFIVHHPQIINAQVHNECYVADYAVCESCGLRLAFSGQEAIVLLNTILYS